MGNLQGYTVSRLQQLRLHTKCFEKLADRFANYAKRAPRVMYLLTEWCHKELRRRDAEKLQVADPIEVAPLILPFTLSNTDIADALLELHVAAQDPLSTQEASVIDRLFEVLLLMATGRLRIQQETNTSKEEHTDA